MPIDDALDVVAKQDELKELRTANTELEGKVKTQGDLINELRDVLTKNMVDEFVYSNKMVDVLPVDLVAKSLVKRIREYSRSQKDIWRQIPYWALQADGRTGFGNAYVYKETYWPLNKCGYDHKLDHVGVNLRNGEIIRIHTNKLASDENVISLVFDMERLNAQYVLNKFKELAKQPCGSWYNSAQQDAWREQTLRELKERGIIGEDNLC